MSAATGIRVSAVVMHHPARCDRIPALLQACRPLVPRVIADPAPDAPPSALRTAKLAWAAVADGATHHLVLQDDVVPMRGFARQLEAALASRSEEGVTLFVHWKSARNAYAVRRAAAAGASWALMSPIEWTPTLGIALPAARARELAAYLAQLPDELADDDGYVTSFRVERGLAVWATVPHLLEHGDGPSLSGYDCEGARFATVFDAAWELPDGHWAGPPAAAGPEPAFGIELVDSRCRIRFFRPGSPEPVEHPFGWYWHDWCALVGIPPEQLLDDWEACLGALASPTWREVPLGLATEAWAAGYLLGADAAGAPCPVGARILRRTIESWLRVGVEAATWMAVGGAGRAALVDICLSGVAAGRASRREVRRDAGVPVR